MTRALQQGVEDLEQSVAEQTAAVEAAIAAGQTGATGAAARPPRTEPAKRNRGALPAHLPRVELVVDVEDKACPCCGGTLHVIGEDRAEMLDYVPAQVRVRVIRRPRYGCRACEEAVVQAPAPERPIDGGMATEALLAHVLVNKYSRPSAAVSPGADLRPPGRDAGPLDAVQLGRPRLLVAGAVA